MRGSQFVVKLVMCNAPAEREKLYEQARQEHGQSFADHLRDQIETHHLIVENERQIGVCT